MRRPGTDAGGYERMKCERDDGNRMGWTDDPVISEAKQGRISAEINGVQPFPPLYSRVQNTQTGGDPVYDRGNLSGTAWFEERESKA